MKQLQVHPIFAAVFLALCLLAGWKTGVTAPVPTQVLTNKANGQKAAPADLFEAKDKLAAHLASKYKRPKAEVRDIVSLAFYEAAQYNLSPLLVLGLIEQESSLVPTVKSGYGAMGLMQVVPRYHLNKLQDPSRPDTLLHPMENIRVGTAILAEYLQRSGGDLGKALRRYSGDARDYAHKVLRNKEQLEQVLAKRADTASAKSST